MAVVEVHLAVLGTEHRIDEVGEARHDLEERPLAGDLEVRNRRLDQVTGAVELVALDELRPPLLRFHQGEERVYVSIFLLRLADDAHEGVDLLLELLVGVREEGVRRRLDPLADVAVLEHHPVDLAARLAGGDAEVFNRVALGDAGDVVVERAPLVGDRLGGDHLRALFPESIAELYGRNGYALHCIFHVTVLAIP